MIEIEEIHIGKIRNSAILHHNTRILETTDRISAFDYVFPFTIKNKAKILQALSVWTFQNTTHIIDNHIIGVLDETHLLVKNAEIIPIEIIVRGYMAGSLWRLYSKQGSKGVFQVYGIQLPENLTKNQPLPTPIITPSTKAVAGHDIPISCEKAEQITGKQNWKFIEKKAFELFAFGCEQATKRKLILVDTKYEMGFYENKIILIDEIHTPDSSRYWVFEKNTHLAPQQISKEFLREELIKIIGEPENLTENPIYHPLLQDSEFNENLSNKVSLRYHELFTKFTGLHLPEEIYANQKFHPWPIDKKIFQEVIQSHRLPSKILVVGNGGRDYTLATEISKYAEVNSVYCAAQNRNWQNQKFEFCAEHDVQKIAKFAKSNDIGLVIVGPELPIAQGLGQFCRNLKIPILAPSATCARLESSKIICKKLVCDAGVLTPNYIIKTWSELKTLLINKSLNTPCVVKYDGLAAGKGVFILNQEQDFEKTLNTIEASLPIWTQENFNLHTPTYSNEIGEPCFLIEDFILGEEISVMALCNGEHYRLLPIAKDYKRRNNFQKGPNTGGMGAIAPVQIHDEILTQIKASFSKTLEKLMEHNTPYYGFLFAGFMVTENKSVTLLEYNCRLGDPETQVILPSLGREFYAELYRTAQGIPFLNPQKSGSFFNYDQLNRIFVVGASPEYPDQTPPTREVCLPKLNDFNNQIQIEFIPSAIENCNMTSGGRAFGVLGSSQNLSDAKKEVYNFMEKIELKNSDNSIIKPHFRTDIGE